MKRSILFAIVLLLPFIALLPVSRSVTGQEDPTLSVETKFHRSENPVPNQYLVMFQDTVVPEEQAAAASGLAQQFGGQVLQSPYEEGINGFSVLMAEANAIALSEDARVLFVKEIPASGFAHASARVNVALAANGGQAFASSTLNSNFPVETIINGDRRGAGWGSGTGGWHDSGWNTFPDYLELHFDGEKRVNQIDLFTLQDNVSNPAEPTAEMTFTEWGVTAFRLNYWNAEIGQWVMIAEVTGNSNVWRTVKFPTVVTGKLSIMILNGGGGFSRVVEIEAWQAPASTNVASAENGGQAFASSTFDSRFPVSAIINGDRSGTGWANGTGGWNDATPGFFPDNLEVHFDGEKRINEIDFFTLQDNFNESVEPTADMTFNQFGVTKVKLSYWNSTTGQWVLLAEIKDNNLVWRKLQFPTIKTAKLSIDIVKSVDNYSRVVEIEAWEAPPASNVALTENGGQAFASSTLNANYPASALINGERNGSGWGTVTGGWHDATYNTFPDYLELHFNGDKLVHQVDLFTLQDNFNNPVAPTLNTTFAQYGVTAFRINYWNSTTAQWEMLREIQGNNKVWRRVEFDPVKTSKLSIMILNGGNSYSRVVEIEAWGTDVDPGPVVESEPYVTEHAPESTYDSYEFAATAIGNPSPSPTANLRLDSEKRYFVYGNDNQTMALIGNSSSYLPHVARNRAKNNYYDPVFENCTYDPIQDAEFKYRKCIDQIKQSGLNHMQIWVVMNHSVGMLAKEGPSPRASPEVNGLPYTHEQPFLRNAANTKWRINLDGQAGFNNEFFTRIRKVVEYCQQKGVIVGVVLFDTWSGAVQGTNKLSPWFKSNNDSNKEFTSRKFFTQADNDFTNVNGNVPTATNPNHIDTNDTNKDLRKLQIALMKRTALELKDLENFYWVLSNEPDFHGDSLGQPLITWLRYMSKILRQYEQQITPGKQHLIAANVTTNPATFATKPADAITKMSREAAIDIITSHYVNLNNNVPNVVAEDRYGAMELIRTFNTYNGTTATTDNTKLWGFSEDKPTGVRNWFPWNSQTFKLWDETWAAAAVRVGAWEFLMNGGGLYDHLSYRWGNVQVGTVFGPSSGNEPQAILARNQLGYLAKFMETLKLSKMRRMMPGQGGAWISPAPLYQNGSYWSAMSRPREGTNFETFLFYFHRSTLIGPRYEPFHANNNTATVTIDVTRMPNVGCYKADWYYPSGETIGGVSGLDSNGALKVVRPDTFHSAGNTTTRKLTSPAYKQDVLLKISWWKTGPC